MHVLQVVDVNEALPRGMAYLRDVGEVQQTRNGPALVAPGPVATVYSHPRHCVLFDAKRNANPFFHLLESLWILAGRDDVRSLSMLLPRMADYSDDGMTFHAPYGYRLRKHFDFDQIEAAIELLKTEPNTRRCVLQIWDARSDLNAVSRDLPCNDMVMLSLRELAGLTYLDMTVCNRSNDIVWGAYGANAVQFSMLQQYIACSIGVEVGKYTQFSNNYHAYVENDYVKWFLTNYKAGMPIFGDTPYDRVEDGVAYSHVLFYPDGKQFFDTDLQRLWWLVPDIESDRKERLEVWGSAVYREHWASPFFRSVVVPMVHAYVTRNLDFLVGVPASSPAIDWLLAGYEWLLRSEQKKAKQS